MKKIIFLLLLVGIFSMMTQVASAKTRTAPILPPPDPNPQPLTSQG